jgi:hypothetical protein
MTAHHPITPVVLQGKPSVRRIGDGQTVIGSTEAVMEFLGLSPQHNEHCKGWRWHMYLQDSEKRMDAVREEARKIIAARRAREDAAESGQDAIDWQRDHARDQRKHERV